MMLQSLLKSVVLFVLIFEAIEAPKKRPNPVRAVAITRDQFLFLTTRRCIGETKDGSIVIAPESNEPAQWITAFKDNVLENQNNPDALKTFNNKPQKLTNNKLPNIPPLPVIRKDEADKVKYKEALGAQYRLQADYVKKLNGGHHLNEVKNKNKIGEIDRNRFVVKYQKKGNYWYVTDVYLSYNHYETFYKLEKTALKCLLGDEKCKQQIKQKMINKWKQKSDDDYPPDVSKAVSEYKNKLHTLYRLGSGYENALRSYNEHLKALKYSKAKLVHIGNELNELYYDQEYDQSYDDYSGY